MKPWLFTSERQPTHDRTPNLAPAWAKARAEQAKRRRRITALGKNLAASLRRPPTIVELVSALDGVQLTPRQAKVRLLSAWGHERGAWSASRIYKSIGWPPLKQGAPFGNRNATRKPKTVEPERRFVSQRERWLARREA